MARLFRGRDRHCGSDCSERLLRLRGLSGGNGNCEVEVCVFDDDGGSNCDSITVTVFNVAPSVEAGPDRVINESGTVFIGPPPATGDHAPATYSDVGFDNPALEDPTKATEENFTSTIDWGEGTVDVGIVTEASGAEEVLTTGTVSGSHVYGDVGPYTVTVCVTDDDGATTCDTFTVTVNNVAPAFDGTTFLGTAITFTSGDDAFLGRKGVLQTHSASASDVGSDNLRYDWAFPGTPDRFSGTLPASPETESTTTFNDGSPPGTLPFTNATKDDLHRARKLAESINKHDNGNQDCEMGTGSGAGSASGTQQGTGQDDESRSDTKPDKKNKKK